MSKTKYICKGIVCRKCNILTHTVCHSDSAMVKVYRLIDEGKRKFYYSQWDKCPKCWTGYFSPEFETYP